ncbi:MAG: 2-phospho-L-lactate guanylyltransferase [Gammaproteobacteria bacterium]|nr:2-phospho-L-lactate guanylyltransferase [Gammaproteobacteria bacterium]
MWAVVPLKNPAEAKQRLASVLTNAERAALMLAMIEDVLMALKGANGLDGILIVSRAPQAQLFARRLDIDTFAEALGADLSEAVQAAGGYLMAKRDVTGTLIVPGDLPLITSADVEAVLDQHDQITLVPDLEGDGTNCIVSSPPNLIRYRFDGHSFKPHLDAAYAIGITPRIVRNDHFGLDIDSPDDLRTMISRLAERSGPSATRTYIESSDIASRLMRPHNASTAV